MKLRRAVVADAAKLSLVASATFLESFANDHDGDEVIAHLAVAHSRDYYAEALARPDVAAWIVEEAVGAPVGYAMLCAPGLPGAIVGDIELKRIYLLSKWHRRGMGAQLYQAVEDEARARGATRLLLSVYEHNHAAQRFYQARGFIEIGRWLFDGFATSEDLIWAKALTP